MNIIVRTYNGRIVVRPDTTWKRGNEDFYPPEFVSRITGSPVVFARISKPGRSVASRFATRYYDSIGCGILLYPENLIDGSAEGFACACCLDRTTYLTFPEMDRTCTGGAFVLEVGDREFYNGPAGNAAIIEKAIEEASRFCYLRTGDYLAVELASRMPVCTSGDRCTSVCGAFCGNGSLAFNIIY